MTAGISKFRLYLVEYAADASPTTPSANEWALFFRPSGLFAKDDAGTIAAVAGGGGISDGDKGSITVSVGGTVWTIDNNAVTLAMLATQAADTVLANSGASAAVPAAVALTEQTVLGMITGGHIAALTVAQLATLALSAALPENVAIILDAALSANGKYSGITEAGTAGATLAFGDLCYLAVADSRWELADSDAEATSGPVKLGMCVLAAAGDASATTMLLIGKIRADAKFPTLTVGAPAYVGATAGEVQVAAPGTGKTVRVVGYANTADELFFNPDKGWLVLA